MSSLIVGTLRSKTLDHLQIFSTPWISPSHDFQGHRSCVIDTGKIQRIYFYPAIPTQTNLVRKIWKIWRSKMKFIIHKIRHVICEAAWGYVIRSYNLCLSPRSTSNSLAKACLRNVEFHTAACERSGTLGRPRARPLGRWGSDVPKAPENPNFRDSKGVGSTPNES